MSKTFIAILLSLFVAVGGAFFLVLRWGSQLPPAPSAQTSIAGPPAPPPLPEVKVTEKNSKKGNVIYIQWTDLPNGTTELEIFRRPKGKG